MISSLDDEMDVKPGVLTTLPNFARLTIYNCPPSGGENDPRTTVSYCTDETSLTSLASAKADALDKEK